MLYAPLTSPMCATCPAHLILLASITLTILGEVWPCELISCYTFLGSSSVLCMILVTLSIMQIALLLFVRQLLKSTLMECMKYMEIYKFSLISQWRMRVCELWLDRLFNNTVSASVAI
jgi:hypothetical protein